MKKHNTATPGLLLCLLVVSALFPGCFKDECTRTYKIFTPVYQTSQQVRDNIKSGVPTDIEHPGKLFVLGSYIFLNEMDKGIHIIDNSNPSAPKNVAFVAIPGNLDLAVKGNILYADMYIDLVALDVSNPLQTSVKKIVANAFPYRRYANGFVADTSKIIVDWTERDTTVSGNCNGNGQWFWEGCPNCSFVADMASYNSAAKAYSPVGISGSMARFSLAHSRLYTVGENDLDVYDVTNAGNPSFTNRVNLGWGIETIYPFKDRLFIGSTTGMFIYDISQPDEPSRLGQFAHVTACDPVIADDDHAFVTLRNGVSCNNFTNQLDVLDISNLSSPALLKSYPLTNPHGLAKDGSTLFVCDGKDGLKVYDAGDVNGLQLLEHLDGFESYDVIAYNKVAMVVAKDGLRQYDYSDRNNLRLLSQIGWKK